MKDIYTLAEEFVTLTKNNSNLVTKLAAGRRPRKQLEKDLAYAKDIYNKHRTSLTQHEKAHADLGSIIDRERKEVSRHREDIMKCYDVLRTMDLHDVAEVRFHASGDVGYVKNNRLFRLNEAGELVPFKRKRDFFDEDLEEGLEETPEEEALADDLLNSLI